MAISMKKVLEKTFITKHSFLGGGIHIMKYAENKVSDIQVAYIGGGSRGWAWTFMTDLSME